MISPRYLKIALRGLYSTAVCSYFIIYHYRAGMEIIPYINQNFCD